MLRPRSCGALLWVRLAPRTGRTRRRRAAVVPVLLGQRSDQPGGMRSLRPPTAGQPTERAGADLRRMRHRADSTCSVCGQLVPCRTSTITGRPWCAYCSRPGRFARAAAPWRRCAPEPSRPVVCHLHYGGSGDLEDLPVVRGHRASHHSGLPALPPPPTRRRAAHRRQREGPRRAGRPLRGAGRRRPAGHRVELAVAQRRHRCARRTRQRSTPTHPRHAR